jgi:hypothetical protein
MIGWYFGGSSNYGLNILTVFCDFLQFLQVNTMLVPFSIFRICIKYNVVLFEKKTALLHICICPEMHTILEAFLEVPVWYGCEICCCGLWNFFYRNTIMTSECNLASWEEPEVAWSTFQKKICCLDQTLEFGSSPKSAALRRNCDKALCHSARCNCFSIFPAFLLKAAMKFFINLK